MAWRIEYEDAAKRDLSGLDQTVAKRIVKYLGSRIASLENPRTLGEPLTGSRFKHLWRYRVGDYRICNLQDELLSVLVVKVGHRREVYR